MERVVKILIDTLNEELDSLSLGHLYNKDRIGLMKNLLSAITYLNYAELDRNEMIKFLQIYEHV